MKTGLRRIGNQESAERRQVTVLHCDIVNSTALVDRLDPEEVLTIMQEYLNQCRALVEESHGVLAGYTGDGFEAYFGYPTASEEPAADALTAGIRIGQMLADWNAQHDIGIECRTGIATGRVVIAKPGIPQVGRTVVAFGSTPHLAARLEKFARPGRILVDDATRRLCEGRFDFRDAGANHFKGFDDEIRIWEVVEELQPGQRFNYSSLSPYVGRHEELQLLISRWTSALEGEGQVVLIHGDPGIGKSRLVYELQKSLASNGPRILQFQCSSQHTASPLHPWIHSVQSLADIQQDDSTDDKLEKLKDYLHDDLGLSLAVVGTCAKLMGLKLGDGRVEGSPRSLLKLLQRGLTDHIVALSRQAPVLLLIEDIQWIDASTLDLVKSIVELTPTERIMFVMTCRSGQMPALRHPHATSLSLTKLDNALVRELIDKLAGPEERALSERISLRICEKSDGNPLFVEELTKGYLEMPAAGDAEWDAADGEELIPDVLQGSLMERIDKAGRGKEIAQLASVIGKGFDRHILLTLTGDSEEVVQQLLDDLVALDILSRSGHGQRASYEFRHALLRDAVYASLLYSRRSKIHRSIADYMVRDGGSGPSVPPEIVAYHFERGDHPEGAFRHWLAAGQRALQAGATEESAKLLGKAMNLSSSLGETPETLESRAALNLAYAHALNASQGVAGEPIRYYRRAEELGAQLQDSELVFEALDWQFGVHFNAGELAAAKASAEKMKQLGLSLDDWTAISGGYQGVGMCEFMLGRFAEARKELEQGLEAARQRISGAHCFPSMTYSYLAWTLFVLGHRTEAESYADLAIESARQESPHAMATALSNGCYVYQCMDAVNQVYARTDELMEHTRKYGELIYLKRGIIIRSWADAMSAQDDKPVQAIARHIEFLLQSKEEIEVTFLLGVLAELQIRHGRHVDAETSLNRAIALAEKNDERFYLSELYRLKAQVVQALSEDGSGAEAAEHLKLARRTAEAQQARAWLERLQAEPV